MPSWLTVPNLVTLARLLLLVPVCRGLLDGPSVLTTALLVVWASTDWVDGALARRLGQTSRVGEMLDPLVDRLGIAAVVLTMAGVGLLPWWVLLVVVVVDVLVVVLAGRAALHGGLRVSRLGKARTAVLFTGIAGRVAVEAVAPASSALEVASTVVLAAGVLLHVLAGTGYVRQARRQGTRTNI